MPISIFKSLFLGLPHDDLRKSIDKRVMLVAYNKQEIKQLGCCCPFFSNRTYLSPMCAMGKEAVPG